MTTMIAKKEFTKSKVLYNLGGVLKILLGLTIASPIIYGLWLSINTNGNIAAMRYFTFDFTLENYREVFMEFNVFRYVANSLIYVAICVV